MSLFTTAGGGSTQLDSSYNISNSLSFNPGDSPYLDQTLGTPTSQRIATFSTWAKFNGQRSGSNDNVFFNFGGDYGTGISIIRTAGTPTVYIDDSDGYYLNFNNGPNLRDPSAWYHLVTHIDTTQSTEANRIKIYINGTQLDNSDASHASYPTQNYDIPGLASGQTMRVSKTHLSVHYIDGYTSEMVYVDGSIVAPTVFAETNNQGIWVPKDFKDDVTFGNNGFYLEFKQTGTSANSSGMGADTSGNDNHFSVNNLQARSVVQDTPTNNFMTWNPLFTNSRGTFAEGNRQVTTNVQGSSAYGQVEFGNMHLDAGKWYWEVEVVTVGSGGSLGLGMSSRAYSNTYTNGHNNGGSSGNVRYNNSSGAIVMGSAGSLGTGATYTDGDTIMFAMDLDNSKFYTGKNGTWNNSQDPANGTNAFTLAEQSSYGDFWTPWISKDDTTHNSKVYLNTGNPVIANDSGNADGNGYGDFEYAVPSGFYAMCTKNIAQYG